MRFTFLGTGTSCGVPFLGCSCEVCQSKDPHDSRLRASGILEVDGVRILIDCGPDIRQQLLRHPFSPIDGVLVTHIHYDHVGGLDDMRAFKVFGGLDIYADGSTIKGIRRTLSYCFAENPYPGSPRLQLINVVPNKPFYIKSVEVMPMQVLHDKLPILGYRIGNFAYITDMKSIEEEQLSYLQGVKTLVLGALRWEKPHHSHMLISDAIAFARRIGAEHTYFTHLSHEIGLHDQANMRLPQGFQLAYDGLVLDID